MGVFVDYMSSSTCHTPSKHNSTMVTPSSALRRQSISKSLENISMASETGTCLVTRFAMCQSVTGSAVSTITSNPTGTARSCTSPYKSDSGPFFFKMVSKFASQSQPRRSSHLGVKNNGLAPYVWLPLCNVGAFVSMDCCCPGLPSVWSVPSSSCRQLQLPAIGSSEACHSAGRCQQGSPPYQQGGGLWRQCQLDF